MEEVMDSRDIKRIVGTYAIDHYVKSGMRLGLGTGSTAIFAVHRLGELLAAGTLRDIKAVSTSFQTQLACETLGIPLYTLNSLAIGGKLDLAIDGADEVDPENNLVKGGGAAHLNEKIVAYAAAQFVIIVDSSKIVDSLGTKFPIPVEVVTEARVPVAQALEKLGGKVTVRVGDGKDGPTITDHGNLVLDVVFPVPVDPARFEIDLQMVPGVVEVGIFTRNRPVVVIGHADGHVQVRN
jgi:ribose 5-phosphate isomerase A